MLGSPRDFVSNSRTVRRLADRANLQGQHLAQRNDVLCAHSRPGGVAVASDRSFRPATVVPLEVVSDPGGSAGCVSLCRGKSLSESHDFNDKRHSPEARSLESLSHEDGLGGTTTAY